MSEVFSCDGCGMPDVFVQMTTWLDNGDIVQELNRELRVAFVESDRIDAVFWEVGKAIGMSIDHLVINLVGRGLELYLDALIPPAIKEMVRNRTMDIPTFAETIFGLAHNMGYGKFEFLGYRYEEDDDDFLKIRITRPFSVLETSGAIVGAITSATGGENLVTYEEVSPGVYEMTARWTTYPDIVKERLEIKAHEAENGDLELERCPHCGSPSRLAPMCRWDIENGMITNAENGYRMALLGPAVMESLFEALELELGEEIPTLVVDAQRRLVREGFTPIDFTQGFEEVRTHFALRGLGNLRELRMEADGAAMRLDNSCMQLLMVGLLQGSFERVYDRDSHVEWELSDKDSLRVEVTPRAAAG
jgi:hypothetical protein